MRFFMVLFLLFCSSANAGIKQKTSYNYFKISGNSAAEIYKSLMAHAKGPSGHDAFALTSTEIQPGGGYLNGKSCPALSSTSYATFKILLPQLTPGKASDPVLSTWRNFADVLKRHEEHHRELWLACTSNFNRAALSLTAKSCGELKSKYLSLWKEAKNNCRLQNQAFDSLEQARFMKQPFIQMVVKGK